MASEIDWEKERLGNQRRSLRLSEADRDVVGGSDVDCEGHRKIREGVQGIFWSREGAEQAEINLGRRTCGWRLPVAHGNIRRVGEAKVDWTKNVGARGIWGQRYVLSLG